MIFRAHGLTVKGGICSRFFCLNEEHFRAAYLHGMRWGVVRLSGRLTEIDPASHG